MRNYYDTKIEIELCQIRLDRLKEQKFLAQSIIYPKSSQIKEVPVASTISKDPLLEYVQKIEEIEEQINLIQQQMKSLQIDLCKMESVLRDVKEPLNRIFVYKYVDGLPVRDIARKMHFSQRRTYQLLEKIETKLGF